MVDQIISQSRRDDGHAAARTENTKPWLLTDDVVDLKNDESKLMPLVTGGGSVYQGPGRRWVLRGPMVLYTGIEGARRLPRKKAGHRTAPLGFKRPGDGATPPKFSGAEADDAK